MMSLVWRILSHPLLVNFAGFIAAALVIWYAGPWLGFGTFRPLETVLVRLILILLVGVFFFLRWLWRWFRARRASRQLMDGLTKSKGLKDDAGPSQTEQELQVLNQRFEEAVATLRKVRTSGTRRRGIAGLLPFSGSQYLYELPWYVFIGPPGSGKTTALVNSGLKFPLADKLGSQSVQGVGGTRNCDWWFTDEAVLIDTAGRYTTQDSDAKVDRSAWDGFLELLKKFRPRRPINGILLTLSASDLLTQSPRERAAQAEAARARIAELYERLGIRFPIYVLVTKADLLAGFTEFFSDLGKAERGQVWGTTFTFAQDKDAPDPLPQLEKEWDGLLARLFERQPQRLRDEKDVGRRALIFGFPQQVAALKPVLTEFLAQVFVTSRYGEAPLLRGVYLTSGTQEGRPIDRVVGGIARAFGLEGNPLAMQSGSGRSFFLTRLLGDVIFEEQTLAGTNLKWEQRRVRIKWGAYAACAILGIGLLGAWTLSYLRNRSYVEDVASRGQEVSEAVGSLSVKADTNVVSLLPLLDAVDGIPRTDAVADGTPTSMTFGLYQGEKLRAGADHAYRRLLRSAFLPRLIYRIEDRLRSIPASDLEQTYEVLKVYVMLQDRTHLEADYAAAAIEFDWDESLPRDVTVEQRAALGRHLRTLLSQDDYASPLPPDPLLIASARSALTRFGLPQRVYSRLKREGIGADYPEFSIAAKAGPSASLVFTRASGKPLTAGVPGMYSFDGYHEAFLGRVGEVSEQLKNEESWVLGTGSAAGAGEQVASALGANEVAEQVRRLYLKDYVEVWDAFIEDVKLKPAHSLSESIQMARILSAPDSPLPQLMKSVVRETTLATKQEEERTITDKAATKIEEQKRNLRKLFGGSNPNEQARREQAEKTPESIVDDHFSQLRYWVQGPGDGVPAPMDGAMGLINEVYVMLSNTETALQSGNPAPPSEAPRRVKAEAARMPEPARSMLQDLSSTGTSQVLGQTRDNLSNAIAQAFGNFCGQALNGRYPFTPGSSRDVTADDFAALFSPSGSIEQFFREQLAPYVNTSTRPWSLKKVEGVPMGYAGSLANFERADTIKSVFFRGSAQAAYRYQFKPVSMDAGISRFLLDVDGQSVSYSHGPAVPKWVNWPGPGGTAIVRLTVEPAGASGSGFTVSGPWAMFRMFDRATVERTGQSERMFVTFNFDGREVRFEVTAGSVQNPYQLPALQSFSCPRGLG